MKTVLVDKFDLNLFGKYPIRVIIDRANKDEVCFELEFKQEEGELINTVTNEQTLVEVSDLCGFVLEEGKEQKIDFNGYERVYVVEKENGKIVFY